MSPDERSMTVNVAWRVSGDVSTPAAAFDVQVHGTGSSIGTAPIVTMRIDAATGVVGSDGITQFEAIVPNLPLDKSVRVSISPLWVRGGTEIRGDSGVSNGVIVVSQLMQWLTEIGLSAHIDAIVSYLHSPDIGGAHGAAIADIIDGLTITNITSMALPQMSKGKLVKAFNAAKERLSRGEAILAHTPLPPASAPLPPPTHVSLATIPFADLARVRALGQGSLGEVYLARWRGSAQVAVKANGVNCADPSAIDNERQLLQTLLSNPHSNIVPVFGMCVDGSDGCVRLVTKYCELGSLGSYLELSVKAMPLLTALKILHQAASGVHHLHHYGILHRDIRSANILVNGRDPIEVYLTDVGVSHQLSSHTGGGGGVGTAVGGGVGTVLTGKAGLGPAMWMAPEALATDADSESGRIATLASDVYMLGGLMFEVLTGGIAPFCWIPFKLMIDRRRADPSTMVRVPGMMPAKGLAGMSVLDAAAADGIPVEWAVSGMSHTLAGAVACMRGCLEGDAKVRWSLRDVLTTLQSLIDSEAAGTRYE